MSAIGPQTGGGRRADFFARNGIWAAAILMPAGFFVGNRFAVRPRE
jgi:hypothetical protein